MTLREWMSPLRNIMMVVTDGDGMGVTLQISVHDRHPRAQGGRLILSDPVHDIVLLHQHKKHEEFVIVPLNQMRLRITCPSCFGCGPLLAPTPTCPWCDADPAMHLEQGGSVHIHLIPTVYQLQ
jgi:hypothetical protein